MYNFGKGFWLMAQPKIWIASTVPLLVGTALAYGMTGMFNFYWFVISMIGLYFIEIGKNALNDLVDYLTGVDLAVAPENLTPFSGGRNRVLVKGYLSLHDAVFIIITTLTIGGAFGLYITIYHEPHIFWIGSLGLFLAVAYSLPPLKFAYRGLGEIAVGIAFGPLIVSGAFVIQAHFLTGKVFLVSLPIGFLIANFLFINQYPDYEADKKYHKNNWLVRLGKDKGIIVFITLFALAYLSIIILAISTRNPFWLLSFLSLPLVIQAVRTVILSKGKIPELLAANICTLRVYQINGLFMLVSAVATRFL